MKKERNASIDLLRVVLMLGVLVIHTCAHGLGLGNLSEGSYTGNQYSYLLIVMQSFSIVAVDVFFIISGYFSGKLRTRRIVEFYIMGGLYCSLAYIVSVIAGYKDFSVLSFGRRALQGFTNYWFLTAYVIIFLFSPFIIKLLDSLDDKQLKRLIVTYAVVNTVFGYLLSSVTYGSGFSVDAMLFCYILGYGIRRFNWTFSWKDRSVNFLCYLIPVMLISALGCTAYSIGEQELSYQIFADYRSPIIIFASVAVFCLFARNVKIKNANISKVVTKAGGGTLAVYLMTDTSDIRTVVFAPIVKAAENDVPVWELGLIIVGYCVVILILCICIDLIRKVIYQQVEGRILKAIEDKNILNKG